MGEEIDHSVPLKVAMNYIGTLGNLAPIEKVMVFHIIGELKDDPAGEITKSARELSRLMGVADRSVQRYVARLRKKGIIRVDEGRSPTGKIQSNSYGLVGWAYYLQCWREQHV